MMESLRLLILLILICVWIALRESIPIGLRSRMPRGLLMFQRSYTLALVVLMICTQMVKDILSLLSMTTHDTCISFCFMISVKH